MNVRIGLLISLHNSQWVLLLLLYIRVPIAVIHHPRKLYNYRTIQMGFVFEYIDE